MSERTPAEKRALAMYLDRQARRLTNEARLQNYRDAVAMGATLRGGHLDTCSALFGSTCDCGKPEVSV